MFPLYLWICFSFGLLALLLVDILVIHKEDRVLTLKESSTMVGFWVLLSSLFGTFLYFYAGKTTAMEYITGYILEFSLSMDNVFVFVLIFSYLRIPVQYQFRVLFWGIIGAIVMRLLMIAGGIYLFTSFQWIMYIFGAILIVSGIKVFIIDDEELKDQNSSPSIIKFLQRFFYITDTFSNGKFYIRENNKIHLTPLFVALVLVEKTDLIFALDSIPAVLAVTQEPFIVYTSNMLAIMGLRSLYFLIEHLYRTLTYVKYGLSVLLIFIGGKMIGSLHGLHIPIEISLLIIIGILITSFSVSWVITSRKNIDRKSE